MIESTALRRHILILAGLALALRLTFVILGLQTQDLAAFSAAAPDSTTYMSVAEYILTGEGPGSRYLFISGPGYPLILVVLRLVFGAGWAAPVVLNILFGVCAPVVIYLIALRLLGRASIALLAGLIVAVSTTGTSMSTSVITDQPFYTLHALALLLFLQGLHTQKSRWFVGAGLMAGCATYVRALGQTWPLIFVCMALLILYRPGRATDWALFRRSLWTPTILLVMILGWSSVMYARYDVFTFSSNGISAAWAYLAARAVADHNEEMSIEDVRAQWAEESREYFAGRQPTQAESYHWIRAHLAGTFRSHPGWMFTTYIDVIRSNVQVPNHYPSIQVPQMQRLWRPMTSVAEHWFNGLLFWLSIAGLGLLVARRQRMAWAVTGLTFAYFTAITGFSYWQGSRLHFPAEMAWSILLAYLVVVTFEYANQMRGRSMLRPGRKRAEPPATISGV